MFTQFKNQIRFLLAIVTFFTCLLTYAQEIGTISRVSGEATITSLDNETRPVAARGKVNKGDSVKTANESEVLVRLKDNSTMLVRAKSLVKFTEFSFEKQASDTAKTDVLAGTLRAVSGQIAKGQPDNVKYSAGTATIGIRGTDIELAIIEEGQSDRAGIYNYVHSGETSMTLASGETANVERELTGFTPTNPTPGEPLLQILRDRPAFLQIGIFDALLQQLTAPRIPAIR